MKKILAIFAALILVITVMPRAVNAASNAVARLEAKSVTISPQKRGKHRGKRAVRINAVKRNSQRRANARRTRASVRRFPQQKARRQQQARIRKQSRPVRIPVRRQVRGNRGNAQNGRVAIRRNGRRPLVKERIRRERVPVRPQRVRPGRSVAIWGGRDTDIRIYRERQRPVRTRRAIRIREPRYRDRYDDLWVVPVRRRIAPRRYVVRDPFVLFERQIVRNVYYADDDYYGYDPYYVYDDGPIYVRRPAPVFSVPYRRISTFQIGFSPLSFGFATYRAVPVAPVPYAVPVYYDGYYTGSRFYVDPYNEVVYDSAPYAEYGYWAPGYTTAYYGSGVYFNTDSSFYRRHRNLVNIGITTGAGAALGAFFSGRRGALIGAGIGAAAGAIYSYGIDPKDDPYRST